VSVMDWRRGAPAAADRPEVAVVGGACPIEATGMVTTLPEGIFVTISPLFHILHRWPTGIWATIAKSTGGSRYRGTNMDAARVPMAILV
jgi:hypothetical protein